MKQINLEDNVLLLNCTQVICARSVPAESGRFLPDPENSLAPDSV